MHPNLPDVISLTYSNRLSPFPCRLTQFLIFAFTPYIFFIPYNVFSFLLSLLPFPISLGLPPSASLHWQVRYISLHITVLPQSLHPSPLLLISFPFFLPNPCLLPSSLHLFTIHPTYVVTLETLKFPHIMLVFLQHPHLCFSYINPFFIQYYFFHKSSNQSSTSIT